MRPSLVLASMAVAAAAALAVPADIASAEESSPIETIGLLEAQGYTVNVDRVGSAPLSKCVVTNVRNPQTVTEVIRVYDGKDRDGNRKYDYIEVVKSRSISVSLDCSR